jgi:hypothetical protein
MMNDEMKRLIEVLNEAGYTVEAIKDLDTPYSMRDTNGERMKGFDIRCSKHVKDEE